MSPKLGTLGTLRNVTKTEPDPSDHPQLASYHSKLCTILQKLERPSIYINMERKKYLLGYIILKTYLIKMFDELADLDDHAPNSINKCSTLPPVFDRLVFELFDETHILRTKRISRMEGSCNAKPKSALLRGIASSDAKRIFKVYFSKEESNKKAASVGAKKSEKSQKNPKKQNEDLYLYVDSNYDPFFQEATGPDEVIETPTPPALNVSDVPKSISHEKYLLVYIALRDAVDALVDTIESFKERSIPSDILGELERCSVTPHQAELEEKVSEHTTSEETFRKASATESQLAYFELLQQTHNQNTQRCFVEQAQELRESLPKTPQEEETESLSNLFSLEDFQRKPEPYCLKEVGAQTDALQEDSTPSEDEKLSESTKESSSSVRSRNMFYFLGDAEEY